MTTYSYTIQPTKPQISVTYHGHTFTFDTTYEVGFFETGDPYVIRPNGGSVTISSKTPGTTGSGSSLRNGAMWNPTPGTVSSYDGRCASYNASGLVAFPFVASGEGSLISVESLSDSGSYVGVDGISLQSNYTYTKSAAILTVLDSVPTGPCLRPPMVGSSKSRYYTRDIDLASLPSLAAVTAAASAPTLASLLAVFRYPWIDHVANYAARDTHPADNMVNYGQHMALAVGRAALRLCGDESTNQKRALALALIQVGIDNYHAWALYPALRPCNGGQNLGRLLPMMLAGKYLGTLSTWMSSLSGASIQERLNTYFGADVSPAETLWTGWASGANAYKKNVLCRILDGLDGNGHPYRHEGYTLSAWKSAPFPNGNSAFFFPWWDQEDYTREIKQGLPGLALSVLVHGMRTELDHEPIIAMADRWMFENDAANRTAMAARGVTDGWNAITTAYDADGAGHSQNFESASGWIPQGGDADGVYGGTSLNYIADLYGNGSSTGLRKDYAV